MAKTFCAGCGNRLEERIIDGRVRLICPSCGSVTYKNPIPATAAVAIDSKRRLLLVRRSVEPGKGLWCLPGGFMEIGETPEQCVLRELKEETGLDSEIGRFIGIEMSRSTVYESVLVAAFTIRGWSGVLKAGDDAEEVRFFPAAELPEIAFQSHLRIIERVFRTGKLPMEGFGAYVITSNDHIRIARDACSGGVRILQYRDKSGDVGAMLKTAKEIRNITRDHGTLFIMNDRIDIALLAEADGVHLGQKDLPLAEVRAIVPPGLIIGLSTHSLEQALEAQEQGADYIGIGPVFASPTKADYPPIGLETLRQVARSVSIPLVAIGGITLGNIDQVEMAGARNVAMVREFERDTSEVVRRLNDLFGPGRPTR
jgi:thiamine-phosphate pyrophosphorylase